MKFCVNCQTNSSHLKFFTLPPVVAVVTIIRYARSESWACTDTLSNHTTSWLEMSGEKSLNELFLEACEDGEEAKVNAAIVLGVDINTKDATSGWTGLMWAIAYRHESIVDILLAHPAIDIKGRGSSGRFPLPLAALHGLASSNRLGSLCPFGQCTVLPTRLLVRQIGWGLSAHLASAL